MIFADIQTTLSVVIAMMVLGLYGAGVCVFLVLRALARTLPKSYEKGGGTPQLARNVLGRLVAEFIKRVIFKR